MQDKNPFQHSKSGTKKPGFKQDCESMKAALTKIKNDSQMANQASVEDQLKVALSGLKHDEDLNVKVSYYRDSKNYAEWGNLVRANYNFKAIAYMFHFFESIETYYQATVDLIAWQEQEIMNPLIDSKPNYQIWQIQIENSLNKLNRVINLL